MLAVIIFYCGFFGLWINIYSVFAVALFGIYSYLPGKKIVWEKRTAAAGFILAVLNIILSLVTGMVK